MKNKNRADISFDAVAVIVILTIFFTIFFAGPIFGVDRKGATEVLEAQGYTQVQITGYRWFIGDKGDFYHTGFKAKSPNGTPISGAVTKGLLFKGATIRFD
jgi:hypothetical protein